MGRTAESIGDQRPAPKSGHTWDTDKPSASHVPEGASLPLCVDKWLINTKLAPFSITYCQLAVMSPPHFRRLQISGDPFSWGQRGPGLPWGISDLTG